MVKVITARTCDTFDDYSNDCLLIKVAVDTLLRASATAAGGGGLWEMF